jgi:very-short-patch-repair endonuclease
MAKQFDTERFNRILKEHNQQLQAEKITGKEVILSNGLILNSEQEVRLCKRRVMNGDNVWKKNFDRIYSTDEPSRATAEQECRSLISVKGGINCQKEHKEKIKQNLNHVGGIPWNKGMKGNYPYSHSCAEDTKKKIGDANRGDKNGMFGRKHSDEGKQHRSELMKEKILLGEFTPNSNNRNTHWDSFYKNKKYRSSWEALYHYFDNSAEYETLRIPYKFDNRDCIYIIDFVNHETKIVIEVKPQELVNNAKTQAKISAAKEWCTENGYTFLLADKDYFLSKSIPTNLTEFDTKTQNKIRKLYETS